MDKLERVARALCCAAYGDKNPTPVPDELMPRQWASECGQWRAMAQAAIAALEPVTVQEARQIADMPPDGTWAVLHPGHYGAFTACALNGKWSMCDDADLRFATHWVPCPFTGRALAERGE